jgi:phosphotransferase system enzyme I (PtsI)
MTAENGKKAGIWTGICGELAADLTLTDRLLELGIEELSVAAPMVLPLRAQILGGQ